MMAELRNMDIAADPEGALQCFLYYMQLRENSYMSIEIRLGKQADACARSAARARGHGLCGALMLDCIEGMQSAQGRTLVLSVPNDGCIPFLQADDVVEVTCNVVAGRDIAPLAQTAVHDMCELYIRLIKRYERLTVEAVAHA